MTKTRMLSIGLAAAVIAGTLSFTSPSWAWWYKIAPMECVATGGGTWDGSSARLPGTGSVNCPIRDDSNMPKTSARVVSVYITQANNLGYVSAARCLHYWWQSAISCGAPVSTVQAAGDYTLQPAQTNDFWINTGAELGYLNVSADRLQAATMNGIQITN